MIMPHVILPVLRVRHVDVDDAVEEPQGIHGVVAPAVVDQREVEARGSGAVRPDRASLDRAIRGPE